MNFKINENVNLKTKNSAFKFVNAMHQNLLLKNNIFKINIFTKNLFYRVFFNGIGVECLDRCFAEEKSCLLKLTVFETKIFKILSPLIPKF